VSLPADPARWDEVLDASGDHLALRRWCWIRPWRIWHQDEEVYLCLQGDLAVLLEEAAAGCPTRDVIVGVVSHPVRDRAHAAVRGGTFRDHVRGAAALMPLARSARLPDLIAYLGRIVRYAGRGVVDEAEARSRVHDLTRCAPPAAVHVERRGTRWMGDLGRSTLTIDAYSGAMSIADR
jgi:hypothetical protein